MLKQLIQFQRQVCANADKTRDMARIRQAAEFVRATNALRLAHEDLTRCPCWYEAVAELDKVSA